MPQLAARLNHRKRALLRRYYGKAFPWVTLNASLRGQCPQTPLLQAVYRALCSARWRASPVL